MAALTMWDVLLNDPTNKPVEVPYTSSFDYFNNMQAARDAEAARLQEEARLRELAAAEFAAAGSAEDRSKQLIKNMYGAYNGEFGGRVLTEDEFKNGWVDALGNYQQGRKSFGDLGMTEEEAQQIRLRNASHDWYNSGMDLFEQPFELTNEWDISDNVGAYGNPEWMLAAEEYLRGNNGGNAAISPWVDTFQHDRIGTYNLIKDPDYNAFLGSFGRRQSNVDGYTDDSIAGYFKNAFAGQGQVGNRRDAINTLRNWNENEGNGGYGLNRATDVMTKQYFDQMDLANKYGLTWEQAGALNNLGGGQGATGGSPHMSVDDFPIADNGNNQGNGMMSGGASSWLDVLNAGGNTNWNGMLGQYTKDKIDPNWAGMNTGQIQQKFGELFDSGMFSQGADRSLIYDKLMENLGRV